MKNTRLPLLLGTALIIAPISALAQDEADAPETTHMTLDRMVISAGHP